MTPDLATKVGTSSAPTLNGSNSSTLVSATPRDVRDGRRRRTVSTSVHDAAHDHRVQHARRAAVARQAAEQEHDQQRGANTTATPWPALLFAQTRVDLVDFVDDVACVRRQRSCQQPSEDDRRVRLTIRRIFLSRGSRPCHIRSAPCLDARRACMPVPSVSARPTVHESRLTKACDRWTIRIPLRSANEFRRGPQTADRGSKGRSHVAR